jgi:hypothetical protein
MSRQYFDFSPLIKDFENPVTVLTYTEAGYDERGKWQEGQEKKTKLKGAVISFKEGKVFRSDGAITSKDKRLFMLQRLPQALLGAKLLYNNQEYRIESELENAEFTGVYSYLLRWVRAFDTV